MPRFNEDLLQAYLEYVKNHEATERVHKWSFISVVAAALEKKVWIDEGYFDLYPNLYTFIIGKSGLVKKSTSTQIAVDLFRELKSGRLMAEKMSAAALVAQLARSTKTFTYEGEDRKHSSVLCYASELAVFMQEVFGNIHELLTTFYDGGPRDWRQPWVYSTMGRGDMMIHGPCLNLLGASTQAWLKRCMPDDNMEGGFASRIIFVVEDRVPEKLVAWPELPKDNVELRARILSDLRDVHNLIGKFAVTVDAKKFFMHWYEQHMRVVVQENSDARLVGYFARKPSIVKKLAMVRAVMLSDALILNEYHLQWAMNMLTELESDWRTAFGMPDPDPVDCQWDLRQYVRYRLVVDRKKVVERLNVYPNEMIEGAINTLVEMGEILALTEDGKPKLRWIGNTR